MYYRPVRHRPRGLVLLFLSAFFLVLLYSIFVFLNNIASQIAVSDAKDAVVSSVNTIIIDTMNSGEFGNDDFVTYEKTDDGTVTLIRSDVAQINSLSAQLLKRIVAVSENGKMMIKVPLGNLTGLRFLMGRGVDIPVEVVVLTSSKVDFSNDIVSAGINQTKHQITLMVVVDIDVFVPWGMESAQVITEVLIADTVIAGRVPDTYLNMN